jgi:predicted nucleic acid-binding protein
VVREFLGTRFSEPFLRFSRCAYKAFILGLPAHGVTGGAAYDALVAATAARCGAGLVTCDRRALPIHERYGVRIHILP